MIAPSVLRRWSTHFALAVCAVFVGCATYSGRIQSVRSAFYDGQIGRAEDELSSIRTFQKGASELVAADRAVLTLLQGDPKTAEELLRSVRDGWDYLEQPSAGERTISFAMDDRVMAYAGEDYEKILVRCLLALSNLMQDGSDVVPYCLQAVDKQEKLMAEGGSDGQLNPKLAYQRIALAPYLHGIVCEASHHSYDDASRAFATVSAWNPQFTAGRESLLRASSGVHSRPGHGVLYVFALVDPGPRKQEQVAPVTSEALAIASLMLQAVGDSNIPGMTAPVKIPEVVGAPRIVHGVQVTVNHQVVGVTETVCDVGEIARQQNAAALPHTVAKAVARRVAKKSAVYAAKRHIDGSPLVGLAMDAGCFAWEWAESADLRCWNLLPGRIQVLRVELPVGQHQIALQPLLNGGRGVAEPCRISIENGRNCFVLACFPGSRICGEVLTSRP